MAERRHLKRKRIMREFAITEVSACDHPAQAHAVSVLMKRDSSREEHEMEFEKITREQPTSFDSLEGAMQFLREQGMTKLAAMEKAAGRHPELVTKFNAQGAEIAKAAADAEAAKRQMPRAVEDFEMIASGIRERDGCSAHVALERARKEHPEKFKAYQEA